MADIEKALAFLGSSINSLVESNKTPVDLSNLHTKIAKRSLTGDHISGGKIVDFSSQGISDQATTEQIVVADTGTHIKSLAVDMVNGDLRVQNTIYADTIVVNHIDNKNQSNETSSNHSLEFLHSDSDSYYGKGLLYKGNGNTKQFIFASKPDRFLSTENIDIAKDRFLSINGTSVLSETELGKTVVKSNLKEVGRLKSLVVDGDLSLGQSVYFNSKSNRFSIGTEDPNATFSISDHGNEIIIGTGSNKKPFIGTYNSIGLEIGTDDTSRISIASNGSILLGNTGHELIQVSVHGKMSIRVANPDPEVDLHINGPMRYHGHLHCYGDQRPSSGNFKTGDVVWNNTPSAGNPVGWVCTRSGSPGSWNPFGMVV
jgi:hypothetical protein